MGSSISTVIIGLVVVVTLFLILREFFCWYYKLNEIVNQLKTSNELLRAMLKGDTQTLISDQPIQQTLASTDSEEECPSCHKMSSKNLNVCEHCNSMKH